MHLENGEISLPICSKQCALEVYKTERHDDGLYKAENGRLKFCIEMLGVYSVIWVMCTDIEGHGKKLMSECPCILDKRIKVRPTGCNK